MPVVLIGLSTPLLVVESVPLSWGEPETSSGSDASPDDRLSAEADGSPGGGAESGGVVFPQAARLKIKSPASMAQLHFFMMITHSAAHTRHNIESSPVYGWFSCRLSGHYRSKTCRIWKPVGVGVPSACLTVGSAGSLTTSRRLLRRAYWPPCFSGRTPAYTGRADQAGGTGGFQRMS